ncbi:hypothetical protein ACOSP7_012894 [Xanthoceras sorbifolium]
MDPETLSCVDKFVAVEDGLLRMKLNLQPCDFVQIKGSCHGLLCLKIGPSSLLFYNPSTKESKQIPEFQPQYFKCGLDYAESIDDYKQMLGIHLNGALHWLVYDFVGPNRVIAAFDLVEENYLHPLCYLNNNSKTLLVKVDFEIWDPNDEKFKLIEVEGIQTGDFLPRVFVESLVSPYYRNDFTDEDWWINFRGWRGSFLAENHSSSTFFCTIQNSTYM